MLTLDSEAAAPKPSRVLLYGPAKSRKTTFAGQAVAANYRVLLFDGDNGRDILKQDGIIHPTRRGQILPIVCHDLPNQARFMETMTFFLKFNEGFIGQDNTMSFNRPDGSYQLSAEALGPETVLVLDSWTKFTASLVQRYAQENKIDLTLAAKEEWDGYRWEGQLASWTLAALGKLNCHVIVIAHQTQYEKRQLNKATNKAEIIWTRRQPVSVSGPHGMSLADKFDTVAYMYAQNNVTFVDVTGDQYNDGGSRVLPPKVYKMHEINIDQLLSPGGFAAPAEPQLWQLQQVERKPVLPVAQQRHATILGNQAPPAKPLQSLLKRQ